MPATYEQVRDWVLALPGGEEVMVESWGHPTLRVGAKMFASGSPDGPTVTVKATPEEQASLIAADPATYSIAPYVGRYGWVTVVLAAADEAELRDLIVDAWRRTAPRRLVRAWQSAHDQHD